MESGPENNTSGNIAVRTCDLIWCQSEIPLCFKMKTSQPVFRFLYQSAQPRFKKCFVGVLQEEFPC